MWKYKCTKIKREKLWIIIIIVLSGIRLWLGELVGAWFVPYSPNDDALMVNYACLYNPFMIDTVSVGDMPVKELMYPFYLLFVEMSGLSYTLVLSLTWIIAGLTTMRLFWHITFSRVYSTFAFMVVVFTPIAFERSTGTRLYRNAILPPFILMVFALALTILIKLIHEEDTNFRKSIVNYVALGFLLMFTCHIKEDGIWLLACMFFATVVYFGIIIIKWKQAKDDNKCISILVRTLAVSCIPLFMYFGLTNVCKFVNYQLFGVYETNIRTEGELAVFVNNVYKVESDNRTSTVWAPADAIEKVFAESETLQEYPELLDNILHTSWCSGNILENPIQGDFLCWVLRDELFRSGIWESERQVTDLFKQVNKELEEAFSRGDLIEDNKIQILPSTGGRSIEEILDLKKDIITEYKCSVLLIGYLPGAGQNSEGDEAMINTASALTNMDFSSGTSELREVEINMANKLVQVVFRIYSVLQMIMCILAIVGVIWSVSLIILNKKCKNEIVVSMMIFVLIGISVAYAFAIAWFSSFLYTTIDSVEVLKFYSVGLIPILSLIELLGSFLFFNRVKAILISISER